MFDRVTDLSENLTGGSGSSEADPGPLADLLADDEQLAHVLANDGTIQYTKDGRETTVEPSGDHDAYALVTDSRLLFVLGDQPEEVEIEIEMTDLTASHVRSGLLSSKLVVKTDDEEVVFDPGEGDLEAAEDFIDRVGDCWVDMRSAFAQARAEMADFEERCANGREPREMALSAKSHLSSARHAAMREDEAPAEKIRARINKVEVELERRRVGAWLERAETNVDQIADAREDGTWDEDALVALADAAEAVDRARETVEDSDHPPEDVEERLATLTDRVDSLTDEFLADVETGIAEARAAGDHLDAADCWDTVAERYRAALDADWGDVAGLSTEAIEYQLAWVDAKRVTALREHARECEREGDADDDSDRAQDRFEAAEQSLERALELTQSSAAGSADELEDAIDRVEEKKLEQSGWEFGKA